MTGAHELAHRHPATVEVARRLGYDVSRLNVGELKARHRGEPFAESHSA